MKDSQQQLILQTLETLLHLQLKSVKQLLGEEEIPIKSSRKKGVRRQSLVHMAVEILTEKQRPLHITELVDLLREQWGRITDRDTLSSALAKKAKQQILVKQTAPATFALIEKKNGQLEGGTDDFNK